MNKSNVINYHITDDCNFDCKYCFADFKMKSLQLEEAKRVIESIESFFRENEIENGRINIAGGEPLMYPHLDEVIGYISQRSIDVSIITNGFLLTKERIASWKGKVSMIGISIDAASIETNVNIGRCNRCRQANTVEHLLELAEAIHKAGIKLKINTVVSKANLEEDMVTIYRIMQPDRLKLICVHSVSEINECVNQEKLIPTIDEFNMFIDKNKYSENCEMVCEGSQEMENSYLMINPQGEFFINNLGVETVYGNVINKPLSKIVSQVPFDINKFNIRYENQEV